MFQIYRRKTHPAKPGCGAFSLMEILIVVGIIAILAAVLFPVFGKVTDESKSTVCMSNLRTIYTGTMNYAADPNGVIPVSYRSASPPDHDYWWMWVVALDGYLPIPDGVSPGSKIWNCPKALALSKQNNGLSPVEWTYLRVKNVYPNWLLEGTAGETRLPGVMNPSNQLFIIDGWLDKEIHAGSLNGAATAWAFMKDPPPPKTSGSTGFIHNGRANAVFFDGHVESFKPGEITQAMVDNPDP